MTMNILHATEAARQNHNVNFPVIGRILAFLALFMVALPAQAQFTESYNFLKAVRERDGTVVNDLLSKPGTTIVNARDIKTGATGLHIVIERRDSIWLKFLLQKGGDPNIADKEGLTPLMLATNLRFTEGVEVLLANKANVDQANRSGETPLIRAVQLGNIALVRLLLKNGADPDRVDSLSGQSARDYASADPRRAPLLAEITKSDSERAGEKKETPVFGPTFRSF